MSVSPQYPVRIERASGFAELVLDRPDRRNAITGPLVEGLLAGLEELRTDDGVKAVLLRGAGGTFCSGLDLDAFEQDPPPAWRPDFGERWLDLHVALFEFPTPVVGALEARPETPVGCVRTAVGPDARRRTRSRCGFICERAQRSGWAHAARTQRARRFAAPGREDSSVNVDTATLPSLLRTRNRRSPRAVPRGFPAGPLKRYAIAGGSGLALACDLLVAGVGARLHVAEAALGMAAPMNVAWLQLKQGLARANDLVMTARPVHGPELAQMGLATAVPDDRVLEEARALAGRLAAHPGRPHAATKRVSAALLGRTPREWFEAAQSAAREPGAQEAQ